MSKTKVLISGRGLNTIRQSGRFPCSECLKDVGVNSVYCQSCKRWVHGHCFKVSDLLVSYENFQCTRCQGLAPTTDKRDLFSVVIGSNSIDVLHSCCYVGDMITSGGVCTEATIICGRTAWRNVLNSMFYALHANEWWALSKDDLLKLERNECAMMHWILTFFH